MQKRSLVVWLGGSEGSQRRRRHAVRPVQDGAGHAPRADWTVAPPLPADSALMEQALSLFDAAMDQCDAADDPRARLIIDRLAVDILACIRERTSVAPAARLQVVAHEARS